MSNTDKGRAYSWDEPEIAKPKEGGEFVLLPAGIYPFEIIKFARARHEPNPQGNGKIQTPCPKAVITIRVDGGELGTLERDENLFLHQSCEGILAQFFCCLGFRNHGDPLLLRFDYVVGSSGLCKIRQKPGIKDPTKTYNEVQQWLDPAPVPEGALPF